MSTLGRFQLSSRRQELLDNLLRAEGIERATSQVVGPRPDPAAPVPLTFSQSRLWFIDQLAAGSSDFVIPAALRVHGDFRLDLFARACQEVVARHESLRTVFGETGGQPFQQVQAGLEADVRLVDLPGLAPDAWPAEIQRHAAELGNRPFDLAAGPLLRVELLQLAPAEAAVLLSMHHIISDQWSMGVLMRELTHSYTALLAGQPSDLPDLRVQYPDFAVWQSGSSSRDAWPADLAYWTQQLAGVPPEIGLPTDRPRPAERTYSGSSVPVQLPSDLVTELRQLAREEGATLFMVLAAAFKVLLMRLSANEDIVVGTPVAGRDLAEVEPLIGFFVNTLALRTDLSGNPTFRELLHRVSQTCLEAYEHQAAPFDRVVEELHPERSLARTPVFQVLFGYGNVPFPGWDTGAVRVDPLPVESSTATFDLTLNLFEDGETVWGWLGYSCDLFDLATVQRTARIFQRLLRGLTADPGRRIGELPLLDAAERREVLRLGAGPERSWPQGWVHECVEERARAVPEAVAVRCDGRSVSYGELNRRANQLARRLQRLGVTRNVLVGVSMERSVELVVSLLAVLKAGGAYVPLDPGYPAARLEYLAADAGVTVLLTQRQVLEKFPPVAAEVLCVAELAVELEAEDGQDLGVTVDGENLAYVIYTSGSTGAPKGAANVHAAIRNRLLWKQDAFGLGPQDRVLQKTPISFDVSVWELLWPLMAGAALVVARPEGHKDSGYLVDTIRAEAVTTVHFVPSMLQVFLQEPGVEECMTLRRVLSGGETLPRDLQDRFFARSPAELHNLYGPAEAAIDVTAWVCERNGAPGPVPIGYPIANTRVQVLDRFGEPVPPGVAGELYIGGANLARGYLNRPELTAEKFVTHSLGPDGAMRLYRTGDLGCCREDGAIEFLGRLDRQVKLRGVRIELGEIESVLAEHAQVREAIVVARVLGDGDRRLVAYLASATGPSASELREFLQARLPEYLVPSAFVVMPEFPLLPNGKVDQGALPDPDPARPDLRTPFNAPAGDIEQSIAGIWRELLGVDQVGSHDNFFDLGGHSLLATKLASRIKKAHGIQLPLREFFDAPTVDGLAASVRQRQALDIPQELPIPRADRARIPLSFAQERLCLHHPLDAEDSSHNVVTGLLLRGALDETALRRALNDLVRRHQPLRTRIVGQRPELRQQVDDAGSWPLQVADLRALSGDEQQRRLHRLIEAAGQRPFRLDAEQLVRGTLVRLAAEETALVLVMHHLVTDNWSYGVLIRDMCEFWAAHAAGREPALPELAVHYPDYAAWQQGQLASGALDGQLDYWRRQLRDLPPALKFEAPEGEDPGAAAGPMVSFAFDPAVTAVLGEIARDAGATLFMVLMAAFDVLLAAYSGLDDVPVAFPEAGRERPETTDLVGYFVNSLVVRTDLSGAPTFRDLVRRVREQTLGAYAHRGVPLWATAGDRVGGMDPSRIVFNLLNADVPEVSLPGLGIERLDIGGGYVFSEVLGNLDPAAVDLALIMREHESALAGTWLYSQGNIDGRALSSMTGNWARLIAWVTTDPGASIESLRRRLRAPAGEAG